MSDGRATQDQKRKRVMRDDDEKEALPSFKKLQASAINESNDSHQGGSSSSSSSTSSDDSIFDFPWLKEGTSTTTISEWSLHEDDAFASFAATENVENEDHRLIAAGEWEMSAVGVEERADWLRDDDEDERNDEAQDDDDGLDCIWKSLLNQQPLSNIDY